MIISLRTSENLNTFSYLYYYNLHTLRGNTINDVTSEKQIKQIYNKK